MDEINLDLNYEMNLDNDEAAGTTGSSETTTIMHDTNDHKKWVIIVPYILYLMKQYVYVYIVVFQSRVIVIKWKSLNHQYIVLLIQCVSM